MIPLALLAAGAWVIRSRMRAAGTRRTLDFQALLEAQRDGFERWGDDLFPNGNRSSR
jgi:hypothetical protein